MRKEKKRGKKFLFILLENIWMMKEKKWFLILRERQMSL